jgi:hypothetical protein
MFRVVQPDFTGDVFRTLFFLFKYVSSSLVSSMDAVRKFYGPLLGHKRPYVRDFAAASFAFLLRKLKDKKALRSHIKGLVVAMGSVPDSVLQRMQQSHVPPSATKRQQVHGQGHGHGHSHKRARTEDTRTRGVGCDDGRPEALKDGVSLLLFEVVKGVMHSFHSRTPDVLRAVFSACRPVAPGGGDGVSGVVLGLRFEVAARTLSLMCRHARSEHSQQVWKLLFSEAGAAVDAWTEACEAAAGVRASDAAAVAAASSSSRKPARKGDAKQGVKRTAEVLQPSALQHVTQYRDAVACHLGRVCSLLDYWVDFRSGDRVTGDAIGHLSVLLRRLLHTRVYLHSDLVSDTRVIIVRLVTSSWRLLAWDTQQALLPRVFDLSPTLAQVPCPPGVYMGIPMATRVFTGGVPVAHELVLVFCRAVLELEEGEGATRLQHLLLPLLYRYLGRIVDAAPAAVWSMLLAASEAVKASAGTSRLQLTGDAVGAADKGTSDDDDDDDDDDDSDDDGDGDGGKDDGKAGHRERRGDGGAEWHHGVAIQTALLSALRGAPAVLTAAAASGTDALDAAVAEVWGLLQCCAAVDVPLADTIALLLALVAHVDASRLDVAGVAVTVRLVRVKAQALLTLCELWHAATSADDSAALLLCAPLAATAGVGRLLSWLKAVLSLVVDADADAVAAVVDDDGDDATGHGVCEGVCTPHATVALMAVERVFACVRGIAPDVLSSEVMASVVPWLSAALSSKSHDARAAALGVLCSFQQPHFAATTVRDPSPLQGVCGALALCLELEALPNAVATERARVVVLERLDVFVRSKRMPETLLLCVVRFAIGVLFVKFAPLWKPAVRLLVSSFDNGYVSVLWRPYAAHLFYACRDRVDTTSAAAVTGAAARAADTADDWSADVDGVSKRSAVLGGGCTPGVADLARRFAAAGASLAAVACTDPETHHRNVLSLLSECPALLEARTRSVVPLFLLFLQHDYFGAANRDDPDASEIDFERCNAELRRQGMRLSAHRAVGGMGNRHTTARLANFLTAFEKVRTASRACVAASVGMRHGVLLRAVCDRALCVCVPRWCACVQVKSWGSAFGKDVMQDVLHRLLLKPDGGVALSALRCLINFKLPHLLPYKESLLRFASDKTSVSRAGGHVCAAAALTS